MASLKPSLLLFAIGCHSDFQTQTRSFVAPTRCGQGPFEVHVTADGTTGGDGVEVLACTPRRRLAGHVEVSAGTLVLVNQAFGDVADNQRCVGGAPARAVTATSAAVTGGNAGTGGGSTAPAATALIERPFTDAETLSDELCTRIGLESQRIVMPTMLSSTGAKDELATGQDFRIRIWSDTPNDLDHVVFMVRKLTSTHSREDNRKEQASRDRSHDTTATPTTTSTVVEEHGPPPAALAEVQQEQTSAAATWVPGYWTWTGSEWGWLAGFWRVDPAMPAPRVELPGAPPAVNAIWIGGTWQRQGTTWIWNRGRWRH